MSTTNNIEIKAYSLTDLAYLYKVSLKTMRRWMQPHNRAIGTREGRYYTALQVKLIFDKLGLPGTIED